MACSDSLSTLWELTEITKELVDLDVSCAQERLGGPAACSISGKHDDKYFKLKSYMQLSFKENINNSVQRISQAIQ
jgi:hypothetical protein